MSGGQMGGGNNEQFLKDMKRGVKQMGPSIKKFESWMAGQEKKGATIPQEMKDKLEKSKAAMSKINSAKDSAELQEMEFDPNDMDMQELERFRGEAQQQEQMLKGMQRGIKGMEQGLKMFEKQVAILAKKNITIPEEISANLTELKSLITTIKNAKTYDEIEAAGIEDMQEKMMNLDQYRGQLEMLTRWPQTLKQINSELNKLTAALKQAKTIVNRLAKKNIDLSGQYAAFEEAVNKLKQAVTQAKDLMQAGNSEEAFSVIENDFFGQMEDTWAYQRVIMTMSNLGRFTSEYKRGIADAQRTIKALKRKKLDVSELEDLYAQSKTKGDELLQTLKAPSAELDGEEIVAALEEMEDLRQQFEAKVAELTCEEEERPPWEQGPPQFKPILMDASLQRYMPKKAEEMPGELVGESNPSPAP